MDVAGKVALLTGGARIGQTVAQAIAQRGCGLALTYRNSRDAAEATAASARAAGVRTAVLRADVNDEAQVAAAVRQTEQVLGRLDILVNLASTYERTPLESAGARAFSDALDANARSAWLFAIHAAPAMRRAGGGRIVNVSDWLPVSGRPLYTGYTPYYASKAAVAALTQSLALELAPVRVNLIAPGFVDTPLSAAILGDRLDARRDELRATLPIGRVVGPADVAALAVHLMTNTAVTGATFDIDGGQQLLA